MSVIEDLGIDNIVKIKKECGDCPSAEAVSETSR